MYKMLISVLFFATLGFVAASVPEIKGGNECQICTLVLKFAQSYVEKNATEAEVISFIENQLCSKLGSYKDVCDQYLESYGQVVINALANKIDPSVICKTIGLCSAKKALVASSPATCEICTLVLTFAQSYVEKNATEEEVLSFIKKQLCARLGSLEATCEQYVEAYGKTIIYMLAQKIDPSIICQQIGVCGKSRALVVPTIDKCSTCKVGLQQIQDLLENPAAQQSVVNFLENNVCSLLGQNANQCKTLLSQYGDIIVQELARLINPDQLCHLAKLCTSSIMTSYADPNPMSCLKCKAAVTTLKISLKLPATQKEIVSKLAALCNQLPEYQSMCVKAIDALGPEAVKDVINKIEQMSTTEICQLVGSCPKSF